MEKLKRQERFIQKLRFKNRVKNLIVYQYGNKNVHTLGVLYRTRVRCSCPTCGNPRYYFKELIVQEKSSKEIFFIHLSDLKLYKN